jgi:hypothetical protein
MRFYTPDAAFDSRKMRAYGVPTRPEDRLSDRPGRWDWTMSQRKAVTKTVATRYRRADKSGTGRILDERAPRPGGIAIMPVRHSRRRAHRGSPGRASRDHRHTGRKWLRRWSSVGRCWGCRPSKRPAPAWASWCRGCATSASWTSMTTPPRCWCRCRRPPSTGA